MSTKTILATASLAALALVTAGRGDDREEALALISKAVRATGDEAKLSKIKAETWRATGKMIFGGMNLTYTSDYAFMEPDKFRFDMEYKAGQQKIVLTVVMNGDQAWEKAGTMFRAMPKNKLEEMRHTVYVMWVSMLRPLKDPAFSFKLLGESKSGDQTLVGIKVSREGRRDVSLFFDKNTFLLAKSETRIRDEFQNFKEVTQEVQCTGYKDLNGFKYFTTLAVKRDGKLLFEEEMSDQESHQKVDAKLFEKP